MNKAGFRLLVSVLAVSLCVRGTCATDIFDSGRFFVGCNYWSSHAGMHMWRDWNGEQVERDFDLLAALERIRAAKAAGGQSAWTVRVAPGLYALDRTLVFTPADSGTPEAPVRWVADEGESIFFGGGLIGGWKILGTDPFECLKTRVLRLPSGWNVVVDAKVRN